MQTQILIASVLILFLHKVECLTNQVATASTSTTTGSITTLGGIGAALNIYAGGLISAGATTGSTSVASGALISAGGLGVAENIYFGGNLAGTAATVSTDSTTGGLVTAGGLGVALDAFIAGSITTTSVTETSDARLKTNIHELSNYRNTAEMITQLRPVSYSWKNTTNNPEGVFAGFLAQEVEQLFPELVRTDGKGWKSIHYVGLIPYAVDVIRQQEEKISMLERKLKETQDASDAKYESLLKRIEALEQQAVA